jgi:hypothetical protein
VVAFNATEDEMTPMHDSATPTRKTELTYANQLDPTHMLPPGRRTAAVISPGQHAVLDYAVSGTFLTMARSMWTHNRRAAILALANGGMVAAMSMMTAYPGGLTRTISFKQHRTGDIIQAALAGLGPIALGFGHTPEAKYFYGQALSEVAVIAATDWNGAA